MEDKQRQDGGNEKPGHRVTERKMQINKQHLLLQAITTDKVTNGLKEGYFQTDGLDQTVSLQLPSPKGEFWSFSTKPYFTNFEGHKIHLLQKITPVWSSDAGTD